VRHRPFSFLLKGQAFFSFPLVAKTAKYNLGEIAISAPKPSKLLVRRFAKCRGFGRSFQNTLDVPQLSQSLYRAAAAGITAGTFCPRVAGSANTHSSSRVERLERQAISDPLK
jgi:hypothetical protein